MNYDPTDPDKMRLPTGKTCGDCRHIKRCKAIYGHTETDTYCDWSPSRFAPAQYSDIVSDGGMDPRNAAPPIETAEPDQGELAFNESEYEPNRFTIGINGKWLMSIQHNGEQLVERQRENMRRLVACWNACQGISTESLEENGVVGFEAVVAANKTTQAVAERLRAEIQAQQVRTMREDLYQHERDAALAALADAHALLKAQRAWIHAIPQDTQLPTMPGFDGDWADDVMAKVAKATGGAA